jgi:hypothetical protein
VPVLARSFLRYGNRFIDQKSRAGPIAAAKSKVRAKARAPKHASQVIAMCQRPRALDGG